MGRNLAASLGWGRLVVACAAMTMTTAALADDAYLRLRCEGESEGANVYVNGKLKGQCPVDLAVPEGDINLEARKDLGQGRYRAYQKTLFLSGGAMKRETVVLGSEIRFTAEGRKLEEARLAAEKVAADKAAAEHAAAAEAARIQAELDAPRLAAEAEAARLAAIKAQPGWVKTYLQGMSSQDEEVPPLTALFFTTYAPVFLPTSTLVDLSDGKSLVSNDPAAFANPDSMVARAIQTQRQRAGETLTR